MDSENTKNEDNQTLSMQEVANLLGISLKTAYEGAKRGDFPAFRVMGRWIVPKPAVDKLLKGELNISAKNE